MKGSVHVAVPSISQEGEKSPKGKEERRFSPSRSVAVVTQSTDATHSSRRARQRLGKWDLPSDKAGVRHSADG